jgi:hypothetical protein
MANRVAGIVYVKCDGQQFEVKGSVEAPIMATMRENVMSLSGLAGYKETAQRQFIKLTAIFTKDFPIALFRSSTNMTIVAEMANGRAYTLAGAFMEGEITAKGDDGEVDVEFSGTKGIWR